MTGKDVATRGAGSPSPPPPPPPPRDEIEKCSADVSVGYFKCYRILLMMVSDHLKRSVKHKLMHSPFALASLSKRLLARLYILIEADL